MGRVIIVTIDTMGPCAGPMAVGCLISMARVTGFELRHQNIARKLARELCLQAKFGVPFFRSLGRLGIVADRARDFFVSRMIEAAMREPAVRNARRRDF